MRYFKLTAVLAATITAGCATAQPSMQAHVNSAVKSNIAAQEITPPAAQKANRNIPQDRALRDAARQRYKTDAVKPPSRTGTQ